MASFSDLSFSRTLPSNVFNQLGKSLQQMVQTKEHSTVITEAILAPIDTGQEWELQRFTIVVSPGFNALLMGIERDGLLIDTKLTFDVRAIDLFFEQLRDLFAHDSQTYQNLESYRQLLASGDVMLQTKFTLLVLEYLLPVDEQKHTEKIDSSCQVVEEALQKQLAQEQLLNQVITQIRQSLDLPLIMATAIEQVRKFLELDRLLICEVPGNKQSDSLINNGYGIKTEDITNSQSHFEDLHPFTLNEGTNYIIYESLKSDCISSVLNYHKESCLESHFPSVEKYRQGFTLAVDDIEKTYALEECFLDFLRSIQVRAKFVAPIVFENKLWGLLIGHQCNTPRKWTENEKNLLTSIAEQLAIAIHQAQLIRSLAKEKQVLEQRVVERTLDLHDALLAAEGANRLRSQFLATISHELLTPLTYVIGMSSTLLRWSFGELNSRQRNYLQTIHDSGEHLLEIINNILDLSQIEAGKSVLIITEFSLINIIENAVKSLLAKATSQQIEIKLDLQIEKSGDRFTADARRIQQVVWNVLSNAIKFTPSGGSITLRLWIENSTAIFQIEDTGIGISEQELPLLFEKFHQLDTSYRRRYEGTGLGLALTKQLVEMHRGRIEVESTVGIGSLFTIWIPPQSKLKLKS